MEGAFRQSSDIFLKYRNGALAGVAQWTECWPANQRLDSQSGHLPGLWARSPVRGVQEAITHWCFPPSLSPSLPLSLKISKLLKKIKYRNEEEHGMLKTEKAHGTVGRWSGKSKQKLGQKELGDVMKLKNVYLTVGTRIPIREVTIIFEPIFGLLLGDRPQERECQQGPR